MFFRNINNFVEKCIAACVYILYAGGSFFMKGKTMIKEVDSCSFRTSIFNLEDSFKIYKSKISEYSKFKSKMRSRTSYRTNNITSTYRR